MKFYLYPSLFLLLISSCSQSFKTGQSIGLELINDDWFFKPENGETQTISIPHIPRLEPLVVNNQWQGVCTYIKKIDVDDTSNTKTFIHFEGVMHDATVYVNDVEVKKHLGGYLPFSVDLTDRVRLGTNEIRVEVSNLDNAQIPPGKPLNHLDFNYYGGIYRDVRLIRKNKIYITDPFIENEPNSGWLIHFNSVTADRAIGFLQVQTKNEFDSPAKVSLKTTLSLDNQDYSFNKKSQIGALEKETFRIPIEISSPTLWSTTNPTLYELTIQLYYDGVLYDEISAKTGIRKIELTDDGFFLNGKKQFIRGTNRHQEYPYVGYALSNNANYRDALKIKNAGFDFVRLSHYPQDEAFMDACDELGLLVMNAIPGWQYYEEGEFVQNSIQDVRDMVRRDRNHPSVVFWEVSLNESGMTDTYMEEANKALKEELPFADTYSAGWIDHPAYDLYIPARQHSSPPQYWNIYKDGERNVFIAEYGDWEYYAHNAGFNQTSFKDLSDEQRNSRQLRKHGEKRLVQQAMNFQEAANSNRRGSRFGTIGHANWLMFDYNRGYANDLEASGISDIFRIPKFAYFFYKSQRPPNEVINHAEVEQGPMVKIAGYWSEESSTKVRVFSNCEQVKLLVNDSLVGLNEPLVNEFSEELLHPPFEFNINQFEPGELVALGLIDGQVVARDVVNSPGNPHKIRLKIDTAGNKYKEDDLIFGYAEIVDKNGSIIRDATHKIRFNLNGDGALVGDNPVNAEAGIASILIKVSKSRKAIIVFQATPANQKILSDMISF